MSSLTGGKTVGDFSTLSADGDAAFTATYGTQISIGKVGQGGYARFLRGSDGTAQVTMGYTSSTSATDFNIENNAPGGITRIRMLGVTPLYLVANGGGSVGVGIAPTAKLHISGALNQAGGSALKFTSAAVLTTPEAGAEEFLSNDRFYTGTDGARRRYAVNGNVIALQSFTVATLPTGAPGDSAYVSDASAPLYGAALVGGGTVLTPVFRNATVWVSA